MSGFEHFSTRELEILRRRAEQVARTTNEVQHDALFTVLSVQVEREHYLLPIESVSNVYKEVNITPIPGTPRCVAGIANIRGHIILVIDLAIVLDLKSQNTVDSEDAQVNRHSVILLANDDLGVALRVSSTGSVDALPVSEMAALPTNVNLANANYLKGILPRHGAVLDIENILNDSRLFAAM